MRAAVASLIRSPLVSSRVIRASARGPSARAAARSWRRSVVLSRLVAWSSSGRGRSTSVNGEPATACWRGGEREKPGSAGGGRGPPGGGPPRAPRRGPGFAGRPPGAPGGGGGAAGGGGGGGGRESTP